MTTFFIICTIWLIHLGTTVTPGPAFLIVAQTSMSRTKRAGIVTALGLGTGTMTVAAIGLLSSGFLLQIHADALWILKIISGSYLAWIGIRIWLNSNKDIVTPALDEDSKSQTSDHRFFINGLIVNLFNPKVVLLFLSLFTTVLLPETPTWARLVVLALVTVNASAWYILVAIFLSTPSMQRGYVQFKKLLDRIFGTALFGAGAWLTQQA